MFVRKAMFTLTRKNMSCHKCYILLNFIIEHLEGYYSKPTPRAIGANLWLSPIGSGSMDSFTCGAYTSKFSI
jgi:hypothetical protein